MAPDGVTIHSARVRLDLVMPGAATDPGIALTLVRGFAEPPAIDDAAELLAATPLHSIAYGFFSSSYVLGADADRALQARLEKRTRGIPVVIPGLAAVRALRALRVRRLALIDPPWFSPELNRMGAKYFRSQEPVAANEDCLGARRHLCAHPLIEPAGMLVVLAARQFRRGRVDDLELPLKRHLRVTVAGRTYDLPPRRAAS
jgi:maleate cis-trans isomerase